jgi:hypothetical protein
LLQCPARFDREFVAPFCERFSTWGAQNPSGRKIDCYDGNCAVSDAARRGNSLREGRGAPT